MRTTVLFRDIEGDGEELAVCKKYLDTVESVVQLRGSNLVIPRYSVLPYYKEVERDVKLQGAKLINTYRQHSYVADLMEWYRDFKEYTAQTWDLWYNLPETDFGFVAKGRTNSAKERWDTHMYAPDKEALVKVVIRNLLDDRFISKQGIVVREYIPLRQTGEAFGNGLPQTDEWRFFFYGSDLISYGYYWGHIVDKEDIPNCRQNVISFACEMALKLERTIGKMFVVIDVGVREDNYEPILIELNDGQMSGLCGNEPEQLYGGLVTMLEKGDVNV